jgi:hypothetical protein
MIPETLMNASAGRYTRLRTEMVEELVADNMDQPNGELLTALETYLLADIHGLDDAQLQGQYEKLQLTKEDMG